MWCGVLPTMGARTKYQVFGNVVFDRIDATLYWSNFPGCGFQFSPRGEIVNPFFYL